MDSSSLLPVQLPVPDNTHLRRRRWPPLSPVSTQPQKPPSFLLRYHYLFAALLGDVHRRGRSREPPEVEAEARVLAQPGRRPPGAAAPAAAPLLSELSQGVLEVLGAAERRHALQK